MMVSAGMLFFIKYRLSTAIPSVASLAICSASVWWYIYKAKLTFVKPLNGDRGSTVDLLSAQKEELKKEKKLEKKLTKKAKKAKKQQKSAEVSL